MNIADPALLVLGLLVAASLAWAAIAVARRRTAALAAAGVAAGSGRGRLAGAWFTIAGIAVLALAVASPTVSIPVSHAKGTVILAVDVSGSMAATDVTPSRLTAAKQAAEAFINAQPGSVDIGVVAFEDGGIETAIPSADHATSVAAVRRLSTGGGTSLGSAIVAALSAITRKTVTITPAGNAPGIGYWPSATIVVFSDGQDGGGASASAGGAGRAGGAAGGGGSGSGADVDAGTAAAVAEQAGVHIDTVGVGTAVGTTVEADGYHLFTALDTATLKSISQTTGGSYHPASNASELNGIASSIDLRLTVSKEPLPLAGALIALALALLAAGAVLTVARTGRVV
ncbi:VWA domain-containing protein [Trebonia kvetii]|uniref:VWA domain-containing protein n=1 Tax=Trebonia kvetii TaxID=2480626 RepID=A0A6P2C902_9ACTN|nr:VWA domain-containing protein [Trebonia kvetii]TVZ06995.1 VWA domain-containing protein [Trebonia kvetii]